MRSVRLALLADYKAREKGPDLQPNRQSAFQLFRTISINLVVDVDASAFPEANMLFNS
jgi:hypothetical protein